MSQGSCCLRHVCQEGSCYAYAISHLAPKLSLRLTPLGAASRPSPRPTSTHAHTCVMARPGQAYVDPHFHRYLSAVKRECRTRCIHQKHKALSDPQKRKCIKHLCLAGLKMWRILESSDYVLQLHWDTCAHQPGVMA